MPANSLTITDNRTGKAYEAPIANGAIRAMDLRQIRTDPDDFNHWVTLESRFLRLQPPRGARGS